MPCPFPEHHKTGGGSGIGAAVAVALAAIAAVRVAGPVVHAAAELLRIIVTIAVVASVLAVAAAVATVAYRVRRGRAAPALPVARARVLPRQAAESLLAPQPRAIARPAEVHLHFHGVTAEDVAAIIAREVK